MCFSFLILQVNSTLPDVESVANIKLKVPLRVYSADGLLISEFGDERRKPVSIKDVPQRLIDSILASEDSNFYRHQGIDVPGLVRAVIANTRSNGKGQGASTITMQVARNFFLSPEKTYTRKIREILLSIKLEQVLEKEEILSLYLNKIFLGHRAYGFGAAAEVYYGRELNELSWAETAMLAGLPKAPSSSNPLRNPSRALARRNYVLERLLSLGSISQEDYQSAIDAEISAVKQGRKTDLAAPHIAEMVRIQLIKSLGEDAYWAGLNVYTTIDSKQQVAAQKSLRNGLQAYDQRHGYRGAIAKLTIDAEIQKSASAEELADYYEQLLSEYPNSQEQVAALITASDRQKAIAQTRNFGQITLTLKDSSWAKRYRNENIVSDAPTSMADLLKVGEVVYVQASNPRADEDLIAVDETHDYRWRLSQIPNVSGALISMQPHSGKILSLIGGYDFFLNKYNRATQSIRQPGSNIKPFIYSASLDKGMTPASLISGAPIVMTDPTHGTVWRPENYSGKFFGPTRMREALAKSLNLVSIRLLRAIGIPYTRDYLSRFGIDMSRFSPTLTMALGSGGITPLELLGAYGVLANSGYKVKPYFIETVTDRDGNVVFNAAQPKLCDECYAQYLPTDEIADDLSMDQKIENTTSIKGDSSPNEAGQFATDQFTTDQAGDTYLAPRIMSRSNNYQTVSMLKDVVRFGTARKALVLERPDIAGKTGTTNDYVDAWFTGFTSQIATTVWVGFDDPSSLGKGEAGGVAALPIWIDFMRTALKDISVDSDEIPDFIEAAWVNRITGERTEESNPEAVPEYFSRQLSEINEGLDFDRNPLEEALDTAIEAGLNPLEEGLYGPGDDAPLSTEATPATPRERVIEEQADTEGLF